MLRKYLVSILVLLYSASAIGLPLHFHYCRGELKHITVLVKMECHPQEQDRMDHACCQGNTTHCDLGLKTKNCCDDATQWVQDDLLAICAKGHELDIPLVAVEAITSSLEFFQILNTGGPVPSVQKYPGTGPPLYVLQCSLIYYG